MKKRNKSRGLWCLLMAAIIIIAGCANGSMGNSTDKNGEGNGNHAQKDAEPIAIWSMTDSVKYTFESFEARHNSTISYKELDGENLPEDILKKLNASDKDAPDIIVLTQEQMDNPQIQNAVMDLGPIVFRHKEAGYSAYQEGLMRNKDKQVKGLAYNVSPIVLAYRRSIATEVLGSDDPQVVGEAFSSVDAMLNTAALLKDGQVLFANPYVMHYFAHEDNLINVLEATSQMKVDKRFATAVSWTDDWLKTMTQEQGSQDSPMTFAYPIPAWAVEQVVMMATVEGTDGTSENPTAGDWAIATTDIGKEWDNGFYIAVTKASMHKGKAIEWVEETLFDTPTTVGFATTSEHIPSTQMARQMIERNDVDAFLGGQSFMTVVNERQMSIDEKAATQLDMIGTQAKWNQDVEQLFVDYVDGNYHTATEAYDTFMAQRQENQDSQENAPQ